jgi:hypothetical protein
MTFEYGGKGDEPDGQTDRFMVVAGDRSSDHEEDDR